MRLRHPRRKPTQSQELPPPRRSWGMRLTQWIYLSVLLLLGLYVLVYLGYRLLCFSERGWVSVRHVVIASARGGRILAEPHGVGACVRKGALLVRVGSPSECRPVVSGNRDRNLRELERRQALDAYKLRMLIEQRKLARAALDDARQWRAMELFSGRQGQMRTLRDRIAGLDRDIALLRQALRLRRTEIDQLNKLAAVPAHAGCEDELIRAPADGVIVAVERKADEVVERATPILDFVPDHAPVEIRAVFRYDEYASLTLGRQVTIHFPDGSESQGRIVRIEATSAPFAMDRVRKNYELERTRVLAIIRPLSDRDAMLWRAFREMEVEVTGWRRNRHFLF